MLPAKWRANASPLRRRRRPRRGGACPSSIGAIGRRLYDRTKGTNRAISGGVPGIQPVEEVSRRGRNGVVAILGGPLLGVDQGGADHPAEVSEREPVAVL